jgi:ankyrin repeat protein
MNFRAKLLAGVCFGLLAFSGTALAAAATSIADAAQSRDVAAVRAMLTEGANVNEAQADGATALLWAAHFDDLELANTLIAAGADANAQNDYGATPLSLACTNANGAMVEALLGANADPNEPGPGEESPLMLCARTGSADAVRALLARGAAVDARDSERQQTALMWASAQGQAEAVQALIDAGADIAARSRGNFTPLLFAARNGQTDAVGVLVDAGADLEETGPIQMTPLLLAAASGQEDTALYLLERGANPNAKDEYGATALHYTVLTGITTLNQIRYANYVDHLFRPNMMRLATALLDRGADPNVQVEVTPLQAGDQEENAYGATPLLFASAIPDPAMMHLLFDRGADASIPTMTGLTPVMVAAGVGRGQDFTEPEKVLALEAVQYAVSLGNDPAAANNDGLTALHGAAANGATELVSYLVEQGADINAKDKYQQTPLSIASGLRLPWIPYGQELGEILQPETAELLLALGATSLDTPDYFQVPEEMTDAFRYNQSQRYGGIDPAAATPLRTPQPGAQRSE